MYLLPLLLSVPVPLQDPASAHEPADSGDLWEALAAGRTWLDFRYRFETVDDDRFALDANASTLRTVLGYESGVYRGFRGLIELEDVAPIGPEDFNSTTNGKGTRPVVADPDGTELNQLYLEYGPTDDVSLKAGRQEIALDNQRFVGNVGWRQNHQSFDALRLTTTRVPHADVTYAFLHNVNRIFGEDHPLGDERMRAHLLNVGTDVAAVGDVSAYAYYLDFDQSAAVSTATYGLRLSGSRALSDDVDVLYTGEYAQQSDVANNPVNVDADYYVAELGARAGIVTLRIGNEHLGGSGLVGDKFTTPLATLHKFNGFADVFLATPDTGLEDRYVSAALKVGKGKCRATYHLFDADSGGMDYGSEVDVDLSYAFTKRIRAGVKLASFDGDDFTFSVTKVMGWVSLAAL